MNKMKKIVIYGASGHGRVCADIAKLNGYESIVFYDDDHEKKKIGKYKVVHVLPDDEYDLFIAIGDNKTRQTVTERMKDSNIVNLIHPSAIIASDVRMGKGIVIMAAVVINSGAVIGDGVIINTYASVDHDNKIRKFSHVSVNAHTAGTVTIGERTLLGIGSSVSNNISVCSDVTIGAGGVVVSDITEKGTYVGVPVKKL